MRTSWFFALALTACAGTPDRPACVEPGSGLPPDLACTGLYSADDPTQYAADVMPYKPGVTLWSDGAEKHRYLHLPPGMTIDTSVQDAWKFPVGTKAWKEFVVNGVLVETRLFSKRSETLWDSGTYIWDAAGSAATLNTAAKGIILDSGYEVPTQKDCDKCHHGGSDRLLGVEAVALALPDAEGATLTALAQQGALSNPPATTAITIPEDSTGQAAAAIGYVHANCGMPCHSSRGLGDETKLVLRLRADEFWAPDGSPIQTPVAMLDTYVSTVNQMPTTAAVAQQFPGALRVTPGDHTKSLIWLVAHLRGNYQMPPLVSHAIDEAGTAKLASWIDALPR